MLQTSVERSGVSAQNAKLASCQPLKNSLAKYYGCLVKNEHECPKKCFPVWKSQRNPWPLRGPRTMGEIAATPKQPAGTLDRNRWNCSRRARSREHVIQWVFVLMAAGLLFRELTLPQSGLDRSWMLATQYGLLEKIDFGRYLIISYGPLSVLTSRLFHPTTWHVTVLFQILCVAITFWPIVGRHWSRLFVVVLFVCLFANRIYYLNDGVVFAAEFSAFLLALLGRRTVSLLGVVVIGVLALAKNSFFFAAVPLFLLADAFTLAKRRVLPLQTFTLLAAMTATFVMVGQHLASLPLYLRNGYEISKFYSEAMSLGPSPWGVVTLAPFVACVLALPLLLLVRARRIHTDGSTNADKNGLVLYVATLGLMWLSLVIYKASFVRADAGHYYIGWNALLLIAPVMLFTAWQLTGASPKIERLDCALIVAMVAIFLATADLRTAWWETRASGSLRGVPLERIREKAGNFHALIGWLDPRKRRVFDRERLRALDRMALRLPIGRETIDVYPSEIGGMIAAGLSYQPRPTMQSYLAYSPYLQQLDLDHWRGQNAPDHLLFELIDIDGRLRTLALGPSIVEIFSRYDAVGAVGERIHLRRRALPHAVKVESQTSRSLGLGEWIPVPNEPGCLTLVSVHLKQTVLGSALSFFGAPPELTIETMLSSGEVRQYRFVASMSELGFAISPDLVPLLRRAGLAESGLLMGLRHALPVKAFRIGRGRLAARAFAPGNAAFSVFSIRND